MKQELVRDRFHLSTKPHKETIVLVTGEAHGLSLVSYAEDFCRKLKYGRLDRDRIIKTMINADTFMEVVNIFKDNFGKHADVYFNYSKL